MNLSAAFPKGCSTDVCLVGIPKAVNIIPEHTWPFLMNPKHLKSHWPTLSLHAHLWTWRLSMCNHDRAKPECLAIFLIESYSFLSHLFLSVSPYPCLIPPVTPFLRQPYIHLVPYHTLLYHYTPYLYHLWLHPDHSFQVPVSSTTSISSLCTLCIPQSEYHLWYSLLWSDPVHVLSLTHP